MGLLLEQRVDGLARDSSVLRKSLKVPGMSLFPGKAGELEPSGNHAQIPQMTAFGF